MYHRRQGAMGSWTIDLQVQKYLCILYSHRVYNVCGMASRQKETVMESI
jgi:hypothetical protein